MVGTKKGAFLLESDERRDRWEVRGPFCNHWPILHVNYDPATESIYAVGGSPWYHAAVWRSRDLGATWAHSSQGLSCGDGGPGITRLWNVTPAHGALFVGAEPAGLFRSDDAGETFRHVAGLQNHPTRPDWQPGNGDLCLHSIVAHPTDPKRMWVAASGRPDLGAAVAGSAAGERVSRRAPGGDGRRSPSPGRHLLRDEHRRALRQRRRGRVLAAGGRVPAADLQRGSRGGGRLMAEVHLPRSLTALFPGAPARLCVEAETVQELLRALDRRWPGMWDRLCDAGPSLREHINVFVDGRRATLGTALEPGAVVRVIPALSGG